MMDSVPRRERKRGTFRGLVAVLAALTPGACAVLRAPEERHAPVAIIFDTDMDTDVDDVGALAMLHALADRGEATLLATMVSSYHPWSAPAVSAINTYFGRPDLPIGAARARGRETDYGSRYARQIAQSFPHDIASNDDAPDAVGLYREILASRPDSSVVIVTVGYLTNLSGLLTSGPDAHSPLSGRELVRKKVRCYVAMGGRYPVDLEPGVWGNFRPSPEAAVHVSADWPGVITFTGGGDFADSIPTGEQLGRELPPDSPVRRAYDLYFRGQARDRHSADQIAVLVAVRGTGSPWQLVTHGYNQIHPDGRLQWRSERDERRHQLVSALAAGIQAEDVAEMIEGLMMHTPAKRQSP